MTYQAAVFLMLCQAATIGAGLDVEKIVKESASIADRDRQANPDYDFKETDRDLDGSTKTYAVHMLLGSPCRELIAVDGMSLPREKQEEEKRKLDQESERRSRESQQGREHRVAQYQKEQNRDRRFMEEFTRAFNFTLIGQTQVDGRQVYIVQAMPRAGYQATDKASKVLTGMRGTLWIDRQTFQWVKVQADVIHPVSIEGFLAKVEPGTRFEMEKAPVGNGIWLPKHFTMTSNARILSVIHHGNHGDETYFDYQKTSQSAPNVGGAVSHLGW